MIFALDLFVVVPFHSRVGFRVYLESGELAVGHVTNALTGESTTFQLHPFQFIIRIYKKFIVQKQFYPYQSYLNTEIFVGVGRIKSSTAAQ